jgi:hypothetical protein
LPSGAQAIACFEEPQALSSRQGYWRSLKDYLFECSDIRVEIWIPVQRENRASIVKNIAAMKVVSGLLAPVPDVDL